MNQLVPTNAPPPKPDAIIDKTIAKTAEFLREYSPSNPEPKRDVLEDRYKIDVTTSLPEFNNKTARAYAAIDMNEGKQLFALVCEPETTQRHYALKKMITLRHPAIVSVVAAGVVELTQPQEARFVIFFERPAGKKLSALLAGINIKIPHNLIKEEIIIPIVQALLQLGEAGITHGSINLDNIYYDRQAMLGPCVVEPCGYSQPFYYEVVERMQAHPAGKGDFHAGADYYALAMTVYQLLFGTKLFDRYTPDTLARAILREGPFLTITKDKELPENYYDFFWGMFGSGSNERWTYRYMKPWLEGKHYNIIPSPPPTEGSRPYECFGTNGHSRREIAHLFQLNMDQSQTALAAESLGHWVLMMLRQKEASENINRLSKIIIEGSVKNEWQRVEYCMRLIMTLDTVGPVRLGKIAFHADGIDTLFAELYYNKSKDELQLLMKYIETNLVSYWLDFQRAKDTPLNDYTTALLGKLERLRATMRSQGLGFGIERVLYDLNPETPCLSPLCRGRYITTLPALLKHLDELAPTLAANQDPIDNHIAAFMASKLLIQSEIKLYDLGAIPTLATHKALIALRLFAVAQHRAGNIDVSGLTHWVVQRILPSMQYLHSSTIRTRIMGMLMDAAEDGKTQRLGDLLLDGEIVNSDQKQYHKALTTYQHNAEHIDSLNKAVFLDRDSSQLAHFIAKLFAYMALLLSVYRLFME